MDKDAERKAFETWIPGTKRYTDWSRVAGHGDYQRDRAQDAWNAWQSACAWQRQQPTAQPAVSAGLACNWTEDEDGHWATTCGNAWTFREGGPADNRCSFCPYCGGKIAQCSYQEPAS